MSIRFIIVLSYIFFLFACSGAKYYVNQAEKFEKSRDYEQAVVHYNEAINRDPENKDARKGLKKSGQRLMNELVDDFEASIAVKNCEEAVKTYRKIYRLKENIERREIKVELPDSIQLQHEKCFTLYLDDLYQQGLKAIEIKNYSLATDKASAIEKLQPLYENLGRLKMMIQAEPIYVQAMDAYNKKQMISAFVKFKEVAQIYPDYKDVQQKLNEIISTSSRVVSIFPFGNQTTSININEKLKSEIDDELKMVSGDLIKIIHNNDLKNAILKIKNDINSRLTNDEMIKISKDFKSDKIINGDVIAVEIKSLPVQNDFKSAYLRERIMYFDPFTNSQMSNFQYREVRYKEVIEEVKVTVRFNYLMLDVKTGLTQFSNVIEKSIVSQLKYATYDGPLEDLYPTTGYISQNDLRKWKTRFDAAKDRKSDEELIQTCTQQVASTWFNDFIQKVFE